MNKGDLMKLVYTEEELRNIDSAIPKYLWKTIDTSVNVMNYNGSSMGVLEDMLKKKTLKGEHIVRFKRWTCRLCFGKYQNGLTAMWLEDLFDDYDPLVATATVNLLESNGLLPYMNNVHIKEYSENEGMTQSLIDSGVISENFTSIKIGFGSIVNECELLIEIPKEK